MGDQKLHCNCTECWSQLRAKLRAFPRHLARENTQLSLSLTPTLGTAKNLVQKNKHSVLQKYPTKYKYPGRWRTLYIYDICFLDLSTLYARSRDGTKSFRMPKARPSSQARDGSCCVPDPGRFPLRLRDGSYPFLPSSFLIRLLDGIQGGPTELNPGIKVF